MKYNRNVNVQEENIYDELNSFVWLILTVYLMKQLVN